MHLTARLVAGLPTLRTERVLRRFRELAVQADRRGVRTVAFAIMGNHIHWLVVPRSRDALHDATRYVFSQLARSVNRWWKRRGQVFADRFFSSVARSVRHAWNQLSYVLRNPWKDGYYPTTVHGIDPFLAVDAKLIGTHRFLRSVFGSDGPQLRDLLWRLTRDRVAFEPLRVRRQPCLPGLDPPAPKCRTT